MVRFLGCLLVALALAIPAGVSAQARADDPAEAPEAPEIPEFRKITSQAALIGSGAVDVYQKDGRFLMAIPAGVFGRKLFWNAETARYPSASVAVPGNNVGAAVVALEKHGGRVFVRALSTGRTKVAGHPDAVSDEKMRPADLAVSNAQLGPVVVAFPVLAVSGDAMTLVDITAAFSADIDGFSAATQIALAGVTAGPVDPGRSYISRVSVFPENVYIRSQLTFGARNPAGESVSVSIEIGHSFTLLPEQPMTPREFNPRVGYFTTEVLEFEGDGPRATGTRRFALRFRLEKADPDAAGPSDPKRPIVFYLSREIPDRWRPYVRQAVEDWQPAFESAGFTNAIIARDAPGIEENPDWAPEDARYNVIRWVAQPFANAMGPTIHDPRTGEIISAHILVWPEVMNIFADYYYIMTSQTDPQAAQLPLSQDLLGRILRYVVSHEVGHTLGLRHNQKASTAYDIASLRDPGFTRANGTVASIMSYGRFNYVAQKGDGVENFFPLIGPYDHFALQWGYAPDADKGELTAILARQQSRPELLWAAGELPGELVGRLDPTVLTENIGSDRITAARLGIRNITAMIRALPGATRYLQDPAGRRAEIYDQALQRHAGLLASVTRTIGGLSEDKLAEGAGQDRYRYSGIAEQKAAVAYLLGEGVDSFLPYAERELLQSFRPVGGLSVVEQTVDGLLDEMLDPAKLRVLYMQQRLEGDSAYAIDAYLSDITDAVIGSAQDARGASLVRQRLFERYETWLVGYASGQIAPPDPGELAAMAEAGMAPELVAFMASDIGRSGIQPAALRELDRLGIFLGKKRRPMLERLRDIIR